MGPLNIKRDKEGWLVEFIAGYPPVFVAKHHWVGFDFDGTISSTDNQGHFEPPYPLGEPIPEMLVTIRSLLDAGVKVKIFTARACEPENIPAIQDWTERHGLGRLEVTHQKDYGMIRFYDDRAIPIVPSNPKQIEGKYSSKLSAEDREIIEGNVFHGAHTSIDDWDTYPWHRSRDSIDTGWVQSSQALSIDLFGTIKVLSQSVRDDVMNSIAVVLGMATDQGWSIDLEWQDSQNKLQERRRTQIDVKAESENNLIFFECKFTESDGGSCSQVERTGTGTLPACSGAYKLQTNPNNQEKSKCALTGKKIRYWEFIPKVFNYDAGQDYSPCPFSGGQYQWMRNLVLCQAVAGSQKHFRAVVVFADAENLQFPKKIRRGELVAFQNTLKDPSLFRVMSYQKIIETCYPALSSHRPELILWRQLSDHIERKIKEVSGFAALRKTRSAQNQT